ncbi:unnamed protein product [Pedinophyceae sp. YPF-701]|nr:unnamed protein product [Pedinophyceae sp. YPF-701]
MRAVRAAQLAALAAVLLALLSGASAATQAVFTPKVGFMDTGDTQLLQSFDYADLEAEGCPSSAGTIYVRAELWDNDRFTARSGNADPYGSLDTASEGSNAAPVLMAGLNGTPELAGGSVRIRGGTVTGSGATAVWDEVAVRQREYFHTLVFEVRQNEGVLHRVSVSNAGGARSLSYDLRFTCGDTPACARYASKDSQCSGRGTCSATGACSCSNAGLPGGQTWVSYACEVAAAPLPVDAEATQPAPSVPDVQAALQGAPSPDPHDNVAGTVTVPVSGRRFFYVDVADDGGTRGSLYVEMHRRASSGEPAVIVAPPAGVDPSARFLREGGVLPITTTALVVDGDTELRKYGDDAAYWGREDLQLVTRARAPPGRYHVTVSNLNAFSQAAEVTLRVRVRPPNAGFCRADCHDRAIACVPTLESEGRLPDACACHEGFGGKSCQGPVQAADIGEVSEVRVGPGEVAYFQITLTSKERDAWENGLRFTLSSQPLTGRGNTVYAYWGRERFPEFGANDQFNEREPIRLPSGSSLRGIAGDVSPGVYNMAVQNVDFGSADSRTATMLVRLELDNSGGVNLTLSPYISMAIGIVLSFMLCIALSICRRFLVRSLRNNPRTDNRFMLLMARVMIANPNGPRTTHVPQDIIDSFHEFKWPDVPATPPRGVDQNEGAEGAVAATTAAAPVRAEPAKKSRAESSHHGGEESRTEGANGGAPSAASDDEPECAICLCEYETGDSCRQLPCAHFFHKKCLDRWMESHDTCPVCRHALVSVERRREEDRRAQEAEAAAAAERLDMAVLDQGQVIAITGEGRRRPPSSRRPRDPQGQSRRRERMAREQGGEGVAASSLRGLEAQASPADASSLDVNAVLRDMERAERRNSGVEARSTEREVRQPGTSATDHALPRIESPPPPPPLPPRHMHSRSGGQSSRADFPVV